jgi:hypothetical protein
MDFGKNAEFSATKLLVAAVESRGMFLRSPLAASISPEPTRRLAEVRPGAKL